MFPFVLTVQIPNTGHPRPMTYYIMLSIVCGTSYSLSRRQYISSTFWRRKKDQQLFPEEITNTKPHSGLILHYMWQNSNHCCCSIAIFCITYCCDPSKASSRHLVLFRNKSPTFVQTQISVLYVCHHPANSIITVSCTST